MSRLARVLPILSLLSLLALLAPPLAAAAEPPAAGPPAAPPDSAAAIDPERLALAHRLVEQSGGEAAMRARLQAMYAVIFKGLADAMPKDQGPLVAIIQTRVEDEVFQLLPKMLEISQEAYAEGLSTQELRDVIAFNESPSGRALREKAPAITQTAMAKMMPLIVGEMPAMLRRVVADACKQANCTPAQKAAAVAGAEKALARSGA